MWCIDRHYWFKPSNARVVGGVGWDKSRPAFRWSGPAFMVGRLFVLEAVGRPLSRLVSSASPAGIGLGLRG